MRRRNRRRRRRMEQEKQKPYMAMWGNIPVKSPWFFITQITSIPSSIHSKNLHGNRHDISVAPGDGSSSSSGKSKRTEPVEVTHCVTTRLPCGLGETEWEANEKILFSRKMVVFHGCSWSIVVCYGLLWFIMVYYCLLWFIVVYFLWFIMVYLS